MTVQLQNIPSTLEDLVLQLRADSDIREEVQQIISEARDVSGKYRHAIEHEGEAVLRNKSVLVETFNPTEVNVRNLKDSLKSLQNALKEVRDDMLILQANVGKRIEKCRARASEYSCQIQFKEIDISCLQSKINALQLDMNKCEEDARKQEERACEYENEAKALNLKASEHASRGLGETALLLSTGVAVSVLTGGIAGMALFGGAAVGDLGVRIHCVKECEENASVHRKLASIRKDEANRHRLNKMTKETEKQSKETEIRHLQYQNDNLNDAMNKLRQIETQLNTADTVIMNVTLNVQNLDTTLYDAEKHGNPFRIIQNAFARNPEKFEGKAQEYLNKLKDKWFCVERDLMKTGESRQIQS